MNWALKLTLGCLLLASAGLCLLVLASAISLGESEQSGFSALMFLVSCVYGFLLWQDGVREYREWRWMRGD